MLSKKNLTVILVVLIFIFGLWLRHKNTAGFNLVFDYDQIEDQFYTYSLVVDRNLPIIGRAVYGDPRLHHGVFYYYYNLIPFLLSKGDLLISVYWNIFFNAAVAVIIFILAKRMLNQNLPALTAAAVVAVSNEIIKFSNWLTIDTVAIFLVPLFFLGLWSYFQQQQWGLAVSIISLGLAIQADLSFLYLIPVLLIYWIIFRPRIPSVKFSLLLIFLFLATILTLVLTEIKLEFAGVKTLLKFHDTFGSAASLTYPERLNLFFEDFVKNFANSLLPSKPQYGIFLTAAIILTLIFRLLVRETKKQEKNGIKFMLLYLFAPALTLVLGYHDKPWFLIGLPPAIALAAGYAISKLRTPLLYLPIIFIVLGSNFAIVSAKPAEAYKLFDDIYDSTSYLKYQLEVIDYTYEQTGGQPFAVNAVTYPLYYNGLWAFLYNWHGRKNFGFLPQWLGGNQLHPYDLLMPSKGNEKIFFMIISETPRIPDIYKNEGKKWALENGQVISEKKFTGFTVIKMERKNAPQ